MKNKIFACSKPETESLLTAGIIFSWPLVDFTKNILDIFCFFTALFGGIRDIHIDKLTNSKTCASTFQCWAQFITLLFPSYWVTKKYFLIFKNILKFQYSKISVSSIHKPGIFLRQFLTREVSYNIGIYSSYNTISFYL